MKLPKIFQRKNRKASKAHKRPEEGPFESVEVKLEESSGVPTMDSTEESMASLPSANSVGSSKSSEMASPPRPTHIKHRQTSHSRHLCLADDDFDGLIVRSRGWVYDPSMRTNPHHRSRNSLAGTDFDKYIFSSNR